MRTVEAGRGVQWLMEAIELIKRDPLTFGLMGLITLLCLMVPIAGALLAPALIAGIQSAGRKIEAGQPIAVGDLFSIVQTPGKVMPLIMLFLPTIVAMIVLVILAKLLPIWLVGILALVVMLALYAAQFTSIARVAFDNVPPLDAMKESINVVIQNIGPVALFVLCMFGVGFVCGLILVIPILGFLVYLVLLMLLLPLTALALHRAYRDIFGGGLLPPGSMPPGPPMAPPPAPM
jgi:hypothetical protein